MTRYKKLALAMLIAPSAAHASALDALLQNGKVSGDLRVYDFSRNFAGNVLTNLHSASAGGKVKAVTGSVNGFSAGIGFYFAHDIGLNNYSQNNKYLNPLLMGTSRSLDVIGEAYLQYQASNVLVRLGNQSIDNPWINPSDGFMIPNLYQGATLAFSPMDGLTLHADRVLRFKNRTVSSFQASNLFELPYSNPKYAGSNNGTLDFGAVYKKKNASAQAWLYNFYDFAKLTYLEGGYKFRTTSRYAPFANVQYMKEANSGAQYLGAVDSTVYGAKLGVAFPMGNAYFAYDKAPYHAGLASPNGNLLSPYTQIYNTDPLYTTVMNYGLVSSRAAGHAWLLGMKLKPLGERLDIAPTLSRYNTAPFSSNVNAFMLDIAYHLGGKLKGLTLRNRLGIEHGMPAWGNTYVDERVMLQYAF